MRWQESPWQMAWSIWVGSTATGLSQRRSTKSMERPTLRASVKGVIHGTTTQTKSSQEPNSSALVRKRPQSSHSLSKSQERSITVSMEEFKIRASTTLSCQVSKSRLWIISGKSQIQAKCQLSQSISQRDRESQSASSPTVPKQLEGRRWRIWQEETRTSQTLKMMRLSILVTSPSRTICLIALKTRLIAMAIATPWPLRDLICQEWRGLVAHWVWLCLYRRLLSRRLTTSTMLSSLSLNKNQHFHQLSRSNSTGKPKLLSVCHKKASRWEALSSAIEQEA